MEVESAQSARTERRRVNTPLEGLRADEPLADLRANEGAPSSSPTLTLRNGGLGPYLTLRNGGLRVLRPSNRCAFGTVRNGPWAHLWLYAMEVQGLGLALRNGGPRVLRL